jgi:tetratricopeptide (TPR) repeat protein
VAAFKSVGLKVTNDIYDLSGFLFIPIQDLGKRVDEVLRKYDPSDTASNSIKKFRIIYSIAQSFNQMPIQLSPLAKFFAGKALTIIEQVDKSSTTWAYLELAIYYDRIGDKTSRDKYALEAELNLAGEDETFVIVTVREKIAFWYYQENGFPKALEKYIELTKNLRETDFLYLKACAAFGLSRTYHKLGQFSRAISACESALGIANELSLPLARKCQTLKDELLRGVA